MYENTSDSLTLHDEEIQGIKILPAFAHEKFAPLEHALTEDNPAGIEEFLKTINQTIKIKNNKALSLLHLAVIKEKSNIFNYLLSHESVNVDDKAGKTKKTPLMFAASSPNALFTRELLKHGANVNERTPFLHNTPLHYAVHRGTTEVLELLLQNGANVNILNRDWQSPLLTTMVERRTDYLDVVALLLFNGADPLFHHHDYNEWFHVPLTYAMAHKFEAALILICDYCFDEQYKSPVAFHTFILAMVYDVPAPIFKRLIDCSTLVEYDEVPYYNLSDFNPELFLMFARKFGRCVRKPLIDSSNFYVSTEFYCGDVCDSEEIAKSLIKYNKCLDNLTTVIQYFSCREPLTQNDDDLVRMLIASANGGAPVLDSTTNVIFYLLSRGFIVTQIALEQCYQQNGWCELFKLLLFMEIVPSEKWKEDVMGMFYYDLEMTIEKCVADGLETFQLETLGDLLDHFAHPKLVEFCLEYNEVVAAKAAKMPRVGSLVELARNSCRKHIIQSYRIENCCRFYTVMNWLPLPQVYKAMLCYQKKLY